MVARGLVISTGKENIRQGEYTGHKLPVDYAMHARSMGVDGIKVQTKQELGSALNKARKNEVSTLIEVLVDQNVSVPGYEAWWDVPVAEVSQSDKVAKVRKDYDQKIKRERDY